MDPISWLGMGGVILVSVAAMVFRDRFRKRLARAWRCVAERAGLAIAGDLERRSGGTELLASRGPLRVRFEHDRRAKRSGTKITVSGLEHSPRPLTVTTEGVVGWIEKKMGQGEVELGAAADKELLIRGDEVLAQALLDAATRERLVDFLHGRFGGSAGWPKEVETSLENGVLEIWVRHHRLQSVEALTERLAAVLTPLLELAQRFSPPVELAERLAERLLPGAGHEPEAGARLRCLRLLLRHFPQHVATAQALPAALVDASDEVRLEAALALGEEGVSTLRALLDARGTADGCAARAFAQLEPSLDFEAVAASLRRALAEGLDELSKVSLEALARRPAPQAQGAIISGLSSGSDRVAAAAARVLGAVGTVTAVPALRQAEERGAGELARAARQAIAQIQARLEGAGEGQLSLAATEVGALSLARETEAGLLSLAEGAPSEPAPLSERQLEEA